MSFEGEIGWLNGYGFFVLSKVISLNQYQFFHSMKATEERALDNIHNPEDIVPFFDYLY